MMYPRCVCMAPPDARSRTCTSCWYDARAWNKALTPLSVCGVRRTAVPSVRTEMNERANMRANAVSVTCARITG
jgi:hypothetical protein